LEPEALMQLALAAAREGMGRGQGPVGCAIARDGEVLAVEHNRVFELGDGTAHAEITALRAAFRSVGARHLEGAVVVTTCEPCPMCATALHYARVSQVWYGASIADLRDAGFEQIPLPGARLLELAGGRVRIAGGLLAEPCRALLRDWTSS
jgi:tRNA(Arg) A34 adenosine deaminase TadA